MKISDVTLATYLFFSSTSLFLFRSSPLFSLSLTLSLSFSHLFSPSISLSLTISLSHTYTFKFVIVVFLWVGMFLSVKKMPTSSLKNQCEYLLLMMNIWITEKQIDVFKLNQIVIQYMFLKRYILTTFGNLSKHSI